MSASEYLITRWIIFGKCDRQKSQHPEDLRECEIQNLREAVSP